MFSSAFCSSSCKCEYPILGVVSIVFSLSLPSTFLFSCLVGFSFRVSVVFSSCLYLQREAKLEKLALALALDNIR